jgi:LysM repeat protein
LLVIVGLTSALVAGVRGDDRPAGEAYAPPATLIIDLSVAPDETTPAASAEGASEETTSTLLGGPADSSAESSSTAQAGAEDQDANPSSQPTPTETGGETAEGGTVVSDDEAGTTSSTYKVKEGDTPYSIANELGTSVDELMAVNGIEDPTALQIGDVLQVPEP